MVSLIFGSSVTQAASRPACALKTENTIFPKNNETWIIHALDKVGYYCNLKFHSGRNMACSACSAEMGRGSGPPLKTAAVIAIVSLDKSELREAQ